MVKNYFSPDPAQRLVYDSFAESNWTTERNIEENARNFFDYPGLIVLNIVNQSIVSGLEVFFKSIIFMNKAVHLAGIGGVVTHRDHRGKGYATQTLEETILTLKRLNIDVAMLCTEPEFVHIYSKVGFSPLGREYYFINKQGEIGNEKGGMIIAINNPALLKEILTSKSRLFVGISNF